MVLAAAGDIEGPLGAFADGRCSTSKPPLSAANHQPGRRKSAHYHISPQDNGDGSAEPDAQGQGDVLSRVRSPSRCPAAPIRLPSSFDERNNRTGRRPRLRRAVCLVGRLRERRGADEAKPLPVHARRGRLPFNDDEPAVSWRREEDKWRHGEVLHCAPDGDDAVCIKLWNDPVRWGPWIWGRAGTNSPHARDARGPLKPCASAWRAIVASARTCTDALPQRWKLWGRWRGATDVNKSIALSISARGDLQ